MAPRRHSFEHLATHLHQAGELNRLFLLVDEKGFLADQAKVFSSFERPTSDLERNALPATIEVQDWERFARYTLMAANLRGLAEELAEEEILCALARQGQDRLAAGLAAQLADPLRRTWARAVLAFCSQEAARADLVRNLREDLENLSGPLTEDRLSLLQGIARHLGPELDDLWRNRLPGWVPDPKEQDEIRWMLAEAWAAQKGLLDSRCREMLAGIDFEILIDRLAGLWLRSGPDDPAEVRKLATELGNPDSRLFWNVAVVVLSRLASAADDSGWAEQAWATQVASGPPVPWSPALFEQGRDLFGRFSASAADRLAAELSDPLHRAALRVVRLELQADPERARHAFMAVEALAEPAIKLHWALRAALAWPKEDAEEKRRLASILTHHLHRRRYAAEATDLARFLDLVATTYPNFLRAQADNVAWAPDMKPASLLKLAESVTQPTVLGVLIDRGESYAAVVGATEAEGFELRTRLLILAARRLCQLQRSWDGMAKKVVEKLLPEEEDELREAAARDLAALGKSAEAENVAKEIRSPRRQLIVQLAIDPRIRLKDGSFKPEDLYEAVASVEAAEDERLALEMLAEPPLDPEALIERYLTRMRDRERQVQALIDLARRAQALEELHQEGQKDPMAPLQLVRSSLTAVGSDAHLLGLTLELVELAAPLQRARALAEVHEAAEVILLRLEVPWELRREAFETLLARLGPILLERPMRNREFITRCSAVAGLVNLLMDLPEKAEESPARDELRAHWHEVFPVILAAAARLPGLVAAHLMYPIRARVWGHWLPEFSQLAGWEKSWNGLAHLDALIPRSWRERLRTRWNGLEFERFTAPWDWLTDDQKKLLRLGFGDPQELPGRITGSAAEQGLVFPLAVAVPARLPEVLRRFEEPERSRLASCLIRDGWVSPKGSPEKYPDLISEILSTITDPALRLDVEARQDGEGWLRALTERVAQHGLDPSDPPAWSLLRRLRAAAQPEALPVLANAVLGSLTRGRERGEEAFRVWLNGFLAPRAESNGEALAQAGRVREALQKALRLRPAGREPQTPGQTTEAPPPSEPDRSVWIEVARLWSQARRQGRWEKRRLQTGDVGLRASLVSVLLLVFLEAGPRSGWLHLSVAGLLHLTAAGGLVLHTRSIARRMRAQADTPAHLFWPSLLTLFPIPFVPFLGFGMYAFALPSFSERTLIRVLAELQSSAARLPRWLELEDIIEELDRARPWWKRFRRRARERPREEGDTALRLGWLYAIKSAASFFDGTALAWLLSRAQVPGKLLLAAAGIFCALGGLGLLLMLIRSLQQTVRAEGRLSFLDRHPVHRFLTASQLAFAAGLLSGRALFEDDGLFLGGVLTLGALCGLAAALPRMFLDSPRAPRRFSLKMALWSLFFAWIAMMGRSGDEYLWLLGACTAFMVPMLPLFILRQLLADLLKPFGLRDIVNPKRSRPLRRALLFLTVTALLPLGGLAVPAWIWIRYRHWPDFEREWQERVAFEAAPKIRRQL